MDNQLIPQANPNPFGGPPLVAPKQLGAVANQLQPQQPAQPINQLAPGPSPDQIQDAHAQMDDLQQDLSALLKKPDSDLSMKDVYGLAADLISKHAASKGKRGIAPLDVAKIMSSKDFPQTDAKGNPPGPTVIRQALQNHFDKALMTQAMLTMKHGAPQPTPNYAVTPSNSNLMNNLK